MCPDNGSENKVTTPEIAAQKKGTQQMLYPCLHQSHKITCVDSRNTSFLRRQKTENTLP
jgi:hypothetical protein